MMYHHYGSPPGLEFQYASTIRSDPTTSQYNLPEKANLFLAWINKMQQSYRGNHLLVPMGDDFAFTNAASFFQQSDAFIKYFNENTGKTFNITLVYSTPSMYIDALKKDNVTWPTKYDDMFPYIENNMGGTGFHSWVGFFTSRPLDKAMIRRAS
jgi:hypothetical protein